MEINHKLGEVDVSNICSWIDPEFAEIDDVLRCGDPDGDASKSYRVKAVAKRKKLLVVPLRSIPAAEDSYFLTLF